MITSLHRYGPAATNQEFRGLLFVQTTYSFGRCSATAAGFSPRGAKIVRHVSCLIHRRAERNLIEANVGSTMQSLVAQVRSTRALQYAVEWLKNRRVCSAATPDSDGDRALAPVTSGIRRRFLSWLCFLSM